jgi:hypothetical protein
MNPSRLGEDLIGSLLFLLLLGLIAWVTTRGRSAAVKAAARAIAGALLFLSVVGNIGSQARDADAFNAFGVEGIKLRDEYTSKFTQLDERFRAIDLTNVITPDSLTKPTEQAAARATLANVRVLLAERRALLQTSLLEMERLAKERAPAGDVRTGALDELNRIKTVTLARYSLLDDSQSKSVESMERMLDWGAAQSDRLKVRQGKFVFADAQQEAEFDALLTQIEQAAQNVRETAQEDQRKAQDAAKQAKRVQELPKQQ